jgi:hypothetical protein
METEGSLPNSQVPPPVLILSQLDPQIISPVPWQVFMFRNKASFYGEELLAPRPTPSWRTTLCRLSVTVQSIYSQLPSVLEAIPPSATWGRAVPWWQGPTHHTNSSTWTPLNATPLGYYFLSYLAGRTPCRYVIYATVLSESRCALKLRYVDLVVGASWSPTHA